MLAVGVLLLFAERRYVLKLGDLKNGRVPFNPTPLKSCSGGRSGFAPNLESVTGSGGVMVPSNLVLQVRGSL